MSDTVRTKEEAEKDFQEFLDRFNRGRHLSKSELFSQKIVQEVAHYYGVNMTSVSVFLNSPL